MEKVSWQCQQLARAYNWMYSSVVKMYSLETAHKANKPFLYRLKEDRKKAHRLFYLLGNEISQWTVKIQCRCLLSTDTIPCLLGQFDLFLACFLKESAGKKDGQEFHYGTR